MSAKEYGWFNRPRLHRRTGKPNKILATQIANVIGVTFGSDRNFWGVIKSCVRVSADKLRADRLEGNNYSFLISAFLIAGAETTAAEKRIEDSNRASILNSVV
jgi:hypothetical protein